MISVFPYRRFSWAGIPADHLQRRQFHHRPQKAALKTVPGNLSILVIVQEDIAAATGTLAGEHHFPASSR